VNGEPDLGAYHRWLYKQAISLLPGAADDPALDDLVQEGRIAMWKAWQVYDDCKGTLAPWLTNAARMRMRSVAHGTGRYTGHTGRRGVTDAMGVKTLLYLDELLNDWEFDETRLRPVVAASKIMTAADVRAWDGKKRASSRVLADAT
jgi:DNA-directed RNA polymerase specialized sigma24 family protein